jgi:DNA-binding NarL/FixJ family response regulator
MKKKFTAISIVEDNPHLRNAWKATLETVSDFLILGDYGSCEEALGAEDIGESDVILMDIGLPGISGIEGVKQLKKKYDKPSILMITVHDDDQSVFDAICAGAVGYLLKATSPDQLIEAIREAEKGGSPMTPNIARKVIAAFQQQPRKKDEPVEKLSEQELQILILLSEGKSYSKIADTVFLSVHGVRYHLRHIYEKLQVKSRAEAVAKGLKMRLINPLR